MSIRPLQASLEAISASRRGAHPDPEKLLAYHLDELQSAAAEAVEQHLALCSDCSRHVLDMELFLAGETAHDARRGNDLDAQRLMRSVKETLAAEQADGRPATGIARQELSTSPKPTDQGAAGVVFLASLGFARAAATVLFVTTAVLAGYLVSNREESAEGVGSTMANVPVFGLTTAETRGPGERDQIRLAKDAPGALLVFPLASDQAFPGYELRVEEQSGDIVLRRSDLQRTAGGLLTLVVPRDFLAAGTYGVTIYGLENGAASRSLADFELDWRLE